MKTYIMLVLFIITLVCIYCISNGHYNACVAFIVGGCFCVVRLGIIDGKQQKKQEELQTRRQLKM